MQSERRGRMVSLSVLELLAIMDKYLQTATALDEGSLHKGFDGVLINAVQKFFALLPARRSGKDVAIAPTFRSGIKKSPKIPKGFSPFSQQAFNLSKNVG